MRPDEFFDVVNHLGRGDEARERSAVSRAYYGCHHEAIATLALAPPSQGSHPHVISRVRRLVDAPTSRRLRELFERRVRADYRIGDAWTAQELSEALAIAEDFRRRIGTIPT